MPRSLTVLEPFRSLFYAPQFVAVHGGYLVDTSIARQVVEAAQP